MPETSTEKSTSIPVQVALRIRPLLPKEIGEGCQECIDITPGEPQVVMGNNKAFTYDYVYGTTASQSDLYNQTVTPLLNRFFKGYNATVLAYGQTGSGKTYSMGTGFTMCTNQHDMESQGVIPRAILDLFTRMENKKNETEFLLKVSFLEIHNEEIHDLLNPTSSSDKIAIRENVDGGIKIAGLMELPVASGEEMVRALCNGSAARATGATAMNSTSSRSHAIFSIIMEQKDKTGDRDIKRAKFHLVDLAGSERCKRTNAQGERFKEGVNINKGLLALGNVISALSDEQRKSNAHVPYRDSKLTRLLQDSLGGNSNTVMIACVSPADSNYEETLNTLRYADRARQIKNKPIVNRDPVSAEMARLKQQVQMLQLQLVQGQTINGTLPDAMGNGVGLNWNELTERVSQLEEENNKLSEELHNSVDQNTKMFEKVLMAELARDKLIRKQEELKKYLSENEIKLDPALQDDKPVDLEMDLASELQKKVQNFEESSQFSTTTAEDHNHSKDSLKHDHSYEVDHVNQDTNDSVPSSPMNSTFESQHALRQAELGRQVQELTKALAMKQELALKMQQNEGAMNEKMVKQYETTVRELESEIGKLEKEKSELAQALVAVKSSTNSEGTSKDRSRIKELETKIVDLKKKQVELQKLQRLQQQNDSTITKLNTEIQSMKTVRVKLMRQMKEESERFRTLKKEKEKEINQLKQQDRKRQFQYSKLQNIHQKQQAVLKRKTEEAALANKRLQEALCKRKEAAEKREKYQSFQNKQSEGLIPRMKSWLGHEVEVLASVSLAKKTLEELIEDRKTISHQLSELRGKIQDEEEQPPKKKKLSMGCVDSDDRQAASDEQRTRMKTLEAELKIKTSQIADLQQQLLAADNHVSGERSKHRWNNIHTMAEAKAGLQVLLSTSVETKAKHIKMEKDIEEQKNQLEELRNESADLTQKHRNQLDFLRRDYDNRVTTLQKEHEDKFLLLLQKIPSEEEKANVERLREKLLLKEKELEEKKQETDILQQKLLTITEAIDNDNESSAQNIVSPADEEISQDLEMVVEDIEEKVSGVRSPKYIYKEDAYEESEDDTADDIQNDPNWVKTPRMKVTRRSKEVVNNSKAGCNCKGKCKTQFCKCKKGQTYCNEDCGCFEAKCINRPKDPATPVLLSSSFESELSNSNDDGLSKPKFQKKKRISRLERKVLANSNRMGNPIKSTQIDAEGRENKTPSSRFVINKNRTPFKSSLSSLEKGHKIRRKSGVLSKKAGVKDVTSRFLATPQRALKTPGSGYTPPTVISSITMKNNVLKNSNKTSNAENKQRKRKKLLNPSTVVGLS